MKPLSLANRVTLLVAVTAVILLGAAALVMDRLIDAEMQRRFDASLLVQARALAALVEDGSEGLQLGAGGRPMQHPLVPTLTQSLAARCPGGKSLAQGADASQAMSLMGDHADPASTRFITLGNGHQRQRAVAISFALYDGASNASADSSTLCHFVLMQPSAPLDDILLETDAILIAVPMAVLLLVLLLAPWLVRRGLQPLAALREHMRGIGPHDPGRRLPASRIGELEPLVARFNEVLERMDEGVLRERRFAGAVAHDTRTHLAELRTLLDVELRHPSQRPPATVLGEISEISAELESTVAALLLLTRLEAGIETLERTAVVPASLVEAQRQHLRSQIAARRLQIDVDVGQSDTQLDTDRNLLKLILANLMTNAIAHAPRDDHIQISLTPEHFCIRNHAPDLEPADVGHLGQRHWQKSHASDTHTGLGLSLAGAATRALGMRLAFELDAAHRLWATLDWSGASGGQGDSQT